MTGFLKKAALVDPKQAGEGDAYRADFLDLRGPFFEGNEDNEGANQEGDLGEFDPDVEGNEG